MPRKNEKETLDRQTSYLTFLPHMDEGFHIGYHTMPGVVCDHNQRPREWLESLARYMQTPGDDVGYSIPDVLSGEQQLRRLSRLSPSRALAYQQMIDYRGVLSLLLLWDTWEKDATCPTLELCPINPDTAFSSSILASLSPARARDGLRLFTLKPTQGIDTDVRPIALLSRSMAITPAADPGDLSALLPPCVTWYDRRNRRFLDPCRSINERDAAYLASRLRLLALLNERSELHSPLYDPSAMLTGVLNRFSNDLTLSRADWRARFERGDDQAVDALRTRVLAAYCLDGQTDVHVAAQPLLSDHLDFRSNPLLRACLGDQSPLPEEDTRIYFLFEGTPFALPTSEYLLEPTRAAGEDEALRRLKRELSLLEEHAPGWRRSASEALRSLHGTLVHRAGLSPRILPLLTRWADELDSHPMVAQRSVTLAYPLKEAPASLCALLDDMLGMRDEALIKGVFSDCLLMTDRPSVREGAACFPIVGLNPPRYAIAPFSPPLCQWLIEREEADALYAPRLEPDSLRFTLGSDRRFVDVSFRISRRKREEGAAPSNIVLFCRSYRLGERLESGSAVLLPELPYVAVWPNVRLTPGLWKQYFVYTYRPEEADVWALNGDGWVQGELHTNASRSWQTACVNRFPAFVAIRRGAISMGALINDLPRVILRHDDPAAIAIDFGSISTTVMMRQDDRIQPAVWPVCLHRTLLCGDPADEGTLQDAFVPSSILLPNAAIEATYFSVMDMFSDQPARWNDALRDGHIYYHETLSDLLDKDANSLYYDLKWGEESYAQRCVRLFLKQVMLQASLSARLWGSPSVTWRVSMPNAMPLHKQEAYLEMMRGLARETAAETGLALTSGVPAVLYASENQADGRYFLSRSEVNASGGYLNLDIGGGTADISLWLGGAAYAAIECSLLLGCREMLFVSLSEWHTLEMEQDFSQGSDGLLAAAKHVGDAFRTECATAQGRRKCMFLLDDLFSVYASDIHEAMANARSAGRISYIESLLLFNIGFLFFLGGELLERAWRDEELKMLLPARMELCIAGNGGQLLKIFTDEQMTRLCTLAMARLGEGHPLRVLLPIQSRNPKQEVARGLLSDTGALQSSLQGVERWNGTAASDSCPENLLRLYLPLFYRIFPQASDRLMPQLFDATDDAALSATAEMELETIFANEKPCASQDDMAMYVRCFAKLKQLWRI